MVTLQCGGGGGGGGGRRGNFVQNVLSENIIVAINHQHNSKISLLQPKILGRNHVCLLFIINYSMMIYNCK